MTVGTITKAVVCMAPAAAGVIFRDNQVQSSGPRGKKGRKRSQDNMHSVHRSAISSHAAHSDGWARGSTSIGLVSSPVLPAAQVTAHEICLAFCIAISKRILMSIRTH